MADLTPEKLFELTGETVAHSPTRRHFGDLPPAERQASEAKAEQLLVSLLDAGQRVDYSASGTFWVDLADGSRIQLGILHRQVHELPTGPIARREMCVVPIQDHMATPLADVWTNLLLVLQSNPDEFLAVANIWTEERRSAADLARLAEAEAARHPERRLTERQLADEIPGLIRAASWTPPVTWRPSSPADSCGEVATDSPCAARSGPVASLWRSGHRAKSPNADGPSHRPARSLPGCQRNRTCSAS